MGEYLPELPEEIWDKIFKFYDDKEFEAALVIADWLSERIYYRFILNPTQYSEEILDIIDEYRGEDHVFWLLSFPHVRYKLRSLDYQKYLHNMKDDYSFVIDLKIGQIDYECEEGYMDDYYGTDIVPHTDISQYAYDSQEISDSEGWTSEEELEQEVSL